MRSVELVVNKPVGRLMSFPVFDSCSEGPMTQNYAIEKRKSSKKHVSVIWKPHENTSFVISKSKNTQIRRMPWHSSSFKHVYILGGDISGQNKYKKWCLDPMIEKNIWSFTYFCRIQAAVLCVETLAL